MTIELRAFEPADRDRVEEIRGEAFSGSLLHMDFGWRNLESPNRSWLWVAEHEGQLVYFHSYMERPIRMGPDIVMPAACGGDAVVARGYRGRGLGKLLQSEARSRVFTPSGPPLGIAWAAKRLARRFYTPTYGHCPTTAGTERWEKLLSWGHVAVEDADPEPADLVVAITYADLPTLHMLVAPDSVKFSRQPPKDPDLRLSIRPSALGALRKRGLRRTVEVAQAALTGRIVLRVRPSSIGKVARSMTRLLDAVKTAVRP